MITSGMVWYFQHYAFSYAFMQHTSTVTGVQLYISNTPSDCGSAILRERL